MTLHDDLSKLRFTLALDTRDLSAERLRVEVVENLDRLLAPGDREAMAVALIKALRTDLRRDPSTDALNRLELALGVLGEDPEPRQIRFKLHGCDVDLSGAKTVLDALRMVVVAAAKDQDAADEINADFEDVTIWRTCDRCGAQTQDWDLPGWVNLPSGDDLCPSCGGGEVEP